MSNMLVIGVMPNIYANVRYSASYILKYIYTNKEQNKTNKNMWINYLLWNNILRADIRNITIQT